ncbi:Uma2 family endonuclease [Streptomyces gobiensis]|uniref:Uma2 family endonuclease n=1 Tax=Streptomyces gobiensis TaxID=2875706 RepID=UPI001E30980B|nr:Uma2 family endonuclease [Streptomyces gobiensis]UGY92376.1 Uma2 family endonuclease [Streptomyces gobiensis]
MNPTPSAPRRPRPPVGGYTANDLDRLPNLPPHTELLDGSLVFVSPQDKFHMRAMRVLETCLLQAAPPELEVIREMTVRLGLRNRPEPDIMVARAEADTGLGQTSYQPADVILAIEVVSPDSEARGRDTKPSKYAAAGIPHFWRVENDNGRPVLYVFELEPATRTYAVTGVHHDVLKTSVPFPVEIDLTAIERRR